MKIYISGPMTGKPDLNEPAYSRSTEAAASVRWGTIVFNPHSILPQPNAQLSGTFHRSSIWATSARKLEALVVLPGWWDSPGATAEVAAALAIEIPCYAEHEGGFYRRPGPLHQGDLDLSDKLEAAA